MTVEQAIEELKQDISLYETDICNPGDGTPDGDLMEALTMAISALEQQTGWISVNDALPEFDKRVLAFVKNKDPENRFNPDGVYVAELKDKIPEHDPQGKKNFWGIPGYDSEWTVWAWSYFGEPCVTHWMPLPKPPAMEAEK